MRLVLIAVLFCSFSSALSMAVAQTASASFAGTTWVSVRKYGGGKSTITFEANGQFTDKWKKKLTQGTWQANADNTEVTVSRMDNKVFQYTLNADKNLLRKPGAQIYRLSTGTDNADAADEAEAPATPAAPEHNAPTVKLTEDQARAIVLIKGDKAEGTGFLVQTKDGPAVVTNIHVISSNPNLKITTNTGAQLTILSTKGATDRDLAMILVQPGDFKYLDLATDISGTVQPGDEVITPGNSEGGEVMLNTDGKVLGIGPDRVEFDNPIYHGNSGGPVFHVKTGKVIGIVTEAIKVDTSDELDKVSFANRGSAIGRSMRYFGLRFDTVPNWEVYDPRRFQNETAFLDQFDKRSRCLDCYLNAPDDNKPEDTLWREDRDISKANNDFFQQASGADTSQQMDADRVMWAEFNDMAEADMAAMQNPGNFYSFDQQRAADEVAYRKAIRAELADINNNVSRLGSLPRSNH
jgi:hypothetical protein